MTEFTVVERHNPLLGLTHGVYRKGETGSVPICLCYSEDQAHLVAAALAAYTPVSMTEPILLPAPVVQPAGQAQNRQANKPQEAKARKPPPSRKGKKPV